MVFVSHLGMHKEVEVDHCNCRNKGKSQFEETAFQIQDSSQVVVCFSSLAGVPEMEQFIQ